MKKLERKKAESGGLTSSSVLETKTLRLSFGDQEPREVQVTHFGDSQVPPLRIFTVILE